MDEERQSQIDNLVHRALTVDPGERVSFLENVCPDAAIREEVTRTLVRLSILSEPQSSNEEPDKLPAARTIPDRRAGKVVGVYRILRRIGQGGMGEVYLAMDTRLERHVALKFLPSQTTGDELLVRRFQLEAKTASSLNHPNILTIFDVGKIDGEHFIASEFVDGITLRSRLRAGPLGLAEALEIVTQAASALVAAHSAGIVHRDLKPTNIMIRPDGYVKVIDFGLAKLASSRGRVNREEEAYTRPGTMVGTIDYMSPEQARGEDVDQRSDIWSLGVVLYEMLAGRKPFDGRTDHHVVISILESDPQPVAETVVIPDEIQRLIDCCLRKDPNQRYASAEELLADLRAIRRTLNISNGSVSAPPPNRKKRRWGMATGIAVTVTLCLWLLWWSIGGRQAFLGPHWFEIADVRQLTYSGKVKQSVISPDGGMLAYVSADSGQESLYLRKLKSDVEVGPDKPTLPPSFANYRGLTFSRDGKTLYYIIRDEDLVGHLYGLPVNTNTPGEVLQDLNGPITFSPDGRHFAFMRKREPSSVESVIVTETDNVHNQKVLFERANTELGVSVAWSPAGDGIAAIEYQRDVSGRVHPTVLLIGMDGSVRKELSWNNWESVANLIWDHPARSLLLTASLHSAGTDQTHLQQLSLSGGAVRDVIKDVSGYRSVSETADGAQITAIRVDRQASIWLRDFGVKDTSQRIASEWEAYDSLAWIGPTKIVASSARGGNLNLWLLDVASSERKRLTSEPFADKTPVALPDRNTIVFSSNRGGDFNLWKLDLGTGRLSQLTSGANYDETPDCTPDGKWIVYTSWRNTKPGIWKVSVAGGNPIRILPVEARTPVVSPDGTQIACEIRENSRAWKVFVVGLGDKRPRRPVAVIPEGAEYRWSPDGNALDFVDNRAGVSNVWRVPLNGGELTQLTSLGEEGILGFRWSPEGTRLACLRGSDRRDVYLFHRKLN